MAYSHGDPSVTVADEQDQVARLRNIVYALVLLILAVVGAGNTLGLGHWRTHTSIVRPFGWLT